MFEILLAIGLTLFGILFAMSMVSLAVILYLLHRARDQMKP